MKKKFLKTFLLGVLLSVFLTGCGLSIYEDWKASGGKAITGGGAIAGKDYVNGLLPSENSRKYFARISAANNGQVIETVSRTDDVKSKTGVKFVKNGGILIPPGVMISYRNQGYCLDPHLPAPNKGHEFQLIPMTQLIPEDLQGIYKKLLNRAANGDTQVQANMQHLMWALRTAGTDAAYANNLTPAQKKILDRCGDYQGQFEEFHVTAKSNAAAMKELLGLADSFLNVKIGGVTYKASDLLDPDVANKKINEHLNQLIQMGISMPVEKSGFNFGELQPGIYTDVRGTGALAFEAKIANSTEMDFIFFPTDYVGQSGSGAKTQQVTFFAVGNISQYQRVTTGNPDSVNICRTPSGDTETVKLNYRSKEKTFDSIAQAKQYFAQRAQELGADNNCVEVHGAIVTDKNGTIYLTELQVSNQNTVTNPDGSITAVNYIHRTGIPKDARAIENIHTHWGQDSSNHHASFQDIQSKQGFDSWRNANAPSTTTTYSIYNATTKTWIIY